MGNSFLGDFPFRNFGGMQIARRSGTGSCRNATVYERGGGRSAADAGRGYASFGTDGRLRREEGVRTRRETGGIRAAAGRFAGFGTDPGLHFVAAVERRLHRR